MERNIAATRLPLYFFADAEDELSCCAALSTDTQTVYQTYQQCMTPPPPPPSPIAVIAPSSPPSPVAFFPGTPPFIASSPPLPPIAVGPFGCLYVNHQYDAPTSRKHCACVLPNDDCRSNIGPNGPHCILDDSCAAIMQGMSWKWLWSWTYGWGFKWLGSSWGFGFGSPGWGWLWARR